VDLCVEIYYVLSKRIIIIYLPGVETRQLLLRLLIGLFYKHWMMDGDDYGAIGGLNNWQLKPRYSEKTCNSSAFRTTNPTLLDPCSNPDRCDWILTTNLLSFVERPSFLFYIVRKRA
jgi:hypothetical protein